MNVLSESVLTRVGASSVAAGIDRRLARAAVATLVIGGYVAIGFAFGLSANGYLLLGIPITIAFQVLVARRPLRALWLREAPAMRVTWRLVMAVIVVAVAPAIIGIGGTRHSDPVLATYGLAAMIGA